MDILDMPERGEQGIPEDAKDFVAPQTNEPTATTRASITLDQRLYDERIIPLEDREVFLSHFQQLPPEFQLRFAARLDAVFKSRDEVTVMTSLKGVVFEMSRINRVVAQGLERLAATTMSKDVPPISYMGYERKGTPDYTVAPTKQVKGASIELDVPLVRNGNPYVYETKSYPRKAYGADVQTRNQLLKYQAAIDQSVVEGATVEVRGRLDRSFLAWAIGERLDDEGHAPDVEMIYTLDLPSGKEYRFVLKRSRKGNGLQFRNEEQYSAEDTELIRGIQRCLSDKSITGLITEAGIDPQKASDTLKPFLADPSGITTRPVFEEYQRLRTAAIVETLQAKAEEAKINRNNKKGALSEYATRSAVERLVQEYQDFLHQNPTLAATKLAYILKPEQIPLAVERTLAALERIAVYERDRVKTPEEQTRQSERTAKGYGGRPEGVCLDVEHVMLDAIFTITKEGYDPQPMEKLLGKTNIDLFFVPSTVNPGKPKF